MDKKKIPKYRAHLGNSNEHGIFAISFVDVPANESNFLALAKARPIKLNLNKPKQILTGAVLIPDQQIYRNDTQLGEYYISFSAADIEKIAQKMMRTGLALSNTTHQHESALDGNYLTEVWIVADPAKDKSAALGLGEFPAGTLMASYKIEDAKYWRDEVLTGNVKGFSLEGFFNYNNIQMSKPKQTAAQALAAKKKNTVSTFLRSLAVIMEGGETVADTEALVDEAKKDETDSATPTLAFELAEGGEVLVDADGYATLDGEQMAAGEHALADGNFIVIDADGNLVITQEEAEGGEPEAAEAALAAAREAGKAFLAAQKKKPAATKLTANAKEILALKAKIAKLEKQPSADQAKPRVEGTGTPAKLTHTAKLASILENRLANKS